MTIGIQHKGWKQGFSKELAFLCLVSVAAAVAAPAQTYTTLFNFDRSDGMGPGSMALTQP